VLMPPETNFDTSTAIRLRSPSRSPPDASCAPFPTRSRQRSSANAAVGGLTPLPEERRRRATTFIFHAAAQSIQVTYLHPDLSLLRAWRTHDLGLGRVQPQPDLLHPAGERRQHHAGFPFRRAVHDRVIRIALELHDREFPCQVQIKRIMHEQVSQDG